MNFSEEYFEDEVRDGFYVPSYMKHAWAAQIEALGEVSEICDRHGIHFFADWGTMLGAVRHGGYIPWDDDLDILMFRKDYEKFLKVASSELPERYEIHNIYNTRDYDNLITRLNTTSYPRYEDDFLEKYHGFPCYTGLDIFVIDYLPRDKKMQKQLAEALSLLYSLRFQIDDVADDEKEEFIVPMEESLGIKIDRNGDIMHQLGTLYEKIASMYTEKESDQLTCMTVWSEGHGFAYDKDCFSKCIKIPFENTMIPVAVGYDRMLRKKYGNYMRQVRNHDTHNYPYFIDQYDAFEKAINKAKYEPLGVMPRRREDGRKLFLENQCNELMGIMDELSDMLNQAQSTGDGNLLAQVNEQIKLVSENASVVLDSIENRHEINVFLPVKAEWWSGLEPIWREVAESEDKEAIVVPLVFYNKNVFGYDTAGFYDIKRFPKETYPIASDQINLADIHPDKIYIQVPFDAYNDGFRVQEEYYTDKLRDVCDQLIYVPYFVTDDITDADNRAKRHLKWQCDVPGFANADIIYVQSEQQKKMYLDELDSFFGDKYHEIFEDKLIVTKLPITLFDEKAKYLAQMPDEYGDKKHLCFHIGLATLLENGNRAIKKLREVLSIFEDNKEKVEVYWVLDERELESLKEYEQGTARELGICMEEFADRGLGRIEELSDRKKVLALSDAYYGDSWFMADLLSSEKKPVMLMDLAR